MCTTASIQGKYKFANIIKIACYLFSARKSNGVCHSSSFRDLAGSVSLRFDNPHQAERKQSDGRILLHMSIMVWKIDKSTISRLTFSETDFDSITKRLPSGLYTTFRTFAQHTKVIGLSAHLARLYQPAKTQGLVIVRTQRKLRQILAQLLNSMGTDEARLRIVLDTTSEPGTLYVMMQVFQVLPEKLYHEGACVALSARSRDEPKLKKTQFISASATERECIGGDVFEILLTHRGRILEGMTSNFFYSMWGDIGDGSSWRLARRHAGNRTCTGEASGDPDPLSGLAM